MSTVTKGSLPKDSGSYRLYCPECESLWSAHRGDYWDVADEHVFTCCGSVDDPHDEVNVNLVTYRLVIEEV